MKPFPSYFSCPKCTFTFVGDSGTLAYKGNTALCKPAKCGPFMIEHMHVTCRDCGYWWPTLCADADKRWES